MSDPTDKGRVVSDEQRARAMLEQLRSVHAADIGRDMVIAAVNYSYPKLGLSDETRAVRDLGDVRVSIELVRAILEVLDRESGAQATSDLHDTLAQMQLAYAHAVQLANAERAAGADEKAADAPAPEPQAAQAEAASGEADAAAGEPEAAATPGEAPKPQAKPAGAKRTAGAKKPPATPAAKKAPAKKPVARKKPAAKKKPAGES